MPSSDANFNAFHSTGLWLAVTTMPPLASWWRIDNNVVGVGARPASMTSQPTDIRPAVAARTNIGPEVRESRAMTTLARTSGFPGAFSDTYAPKAAAKCAMISGVSASPTLPRTPETLTIRSRGISNAMLIIVARILPRSRKEPLQQILQCARVLGIDPVATVDFVEVNAVRGFHRLHALHRLRVQHAAFFGLDHVDLERA